jgi:formylglycine-generating enzyme required for sulfatase activity
MSSVRALPREANVSISYRRRQCRQKVNKEKNMNVRKLVGLVALTLLLAAGAVQAVVIQTVPVGNPGNAADTTGYGSVAYSYSIGTYEVTVAQYCAFLNAVATTEKYNLGDTQSPSIVRSGSQGSYSYTVATGYADRPVNRVLFGATLRYANWLSNGQPTGLQDASTTETGAYTLNGAESNAALMAVTRNANWKWALPSENEWYKAAYYKAGGTNAGYWAYPTQSDTGPSNVGADNYLDPGNSANSCGSNNQYTIGAPYYRTMVGEFENSAGAYGTFDMGGNVAEYTEGVMDIGVPGAPDLQRVKRGGDYYNLDSAMNSANRYVAPVGPSSIRNDLGFRVVEQVPEPATISLLVLSGLAMLKRRSA